MCNYNIVLLFLGHNVPQQQQFAEVTSTSLPASANQVGDTPTHLAPAAAPGLGQQLFEDANLGGEATNDENGSYLTEFGNLDEEVHIALVLLGSLMPPWQ